MEIALSVVVFATLASFSANFFLYRQNKALKKSPPKQESYEVLQLMHDLTAGAGLIRVTRVAPIDVLIRSPKDRS